MRKRPATEGEPAPSQEEIDELFEDRITPETDLPPMMPLFEMFDVPCALLRQSGKCCRLNEPVRRL